MMVLNSYSRLKREVGLGSLLSEEEGSFETQTGAREGMQKSPENAGVCHDRVNGRNRRRQNACLRPVRSADEAMSMGAEGCSVCS